MHDVPPAVESKPAKLAEKQDALYALVTQVSQARPQPEPLYSTYETLANKSFKQPHYTLEDHFGPPATTTATSATKTLEKRMQALENEKIALIKRHVFFFK